MKLPQFTIYSLLSATALAGTFIAIWKLLYVWWPLKTVPGVEDWHHGLMQAMFMMAGVTWGARLNYKRQHWWLPGAWLGLGVGVVICISLMCFAYLISR